MSEEANTTKGSVPPPSKKKKKSPADLQKELQDLGKSKAPPPDPGPQIRKMAIRVGAALVVLWIVALFLPMWGKIAAAVLTVVVAGLAVWILRYVKKSQALGDILRGAETAEGRKEALDRLDKEFKKGDSQAIFARAQLEMQEDPRKALTTLEQVDLTKQLPPMADQIRALRAMIHLQLGEPTEARALVDKMEMGKQQEPKTRAMFGTVAGEAWARTGQAKKALEALEVFNPEDPEYAELRMQMWRARAYAYASLNDLKGVGRSLKKLADINPQLLTMFLTGKRVHPLLEREAKNLLMRSGAVPRKMVRQRM